MDWNWFFSSLAQSAAAIVGVFGAFIITKILSNQTVFSEKKNRLKELLAEAEKIKGDAQALSFDWRNKYRLYGAQRDFEKLLNDGTEENEPEEERSKWKNGNVESIEKMQEAIKFVEREARHHTRLLSDVHNSIKGNPESSCAINIALFLVSVLFCVGVIYPLSFMPTASSNWAPPAFSLQVFCDSTFQLKDIKDALLIAIFFIFAVIIFMFFLININMKYNTDDIEKIKQFKSIGTYSQYFAIMEGNRRLTL